jgi:hypothetical protein
MKSVRQSVDERSLPNSGSAPDEGIVNFLDVASKWQREVMQFALLRVSRYVEHTSQFLRCKTPTDIAKVQTSFVHKTLSDYGSVSGLFSLQLKPESLLPDVIGVTAQSYEGSILQAQRHAAKIIELAKEQAAHIVEEAAARSEKPSALSRRRSGSNRARGH